METKRQCFRWLNGCTPCNGSYPSQDARVKRFRLHRAHPRSRPAGKDPVFIYLYRGPFLDPKAAAGDRVYTAQGSKSPSRGRPATFFCEGSNCVTENVCHCERLKGARQSRSLRHLTGLLRRPASGGTPRNDMVRRSLQHQIRVTGSFETSARPSKI
jgi:hypothetical protein